ncbi:MAG: M23 family metallopeptidase, partial [bacterium]|nr:M23 family metallopeptidase [bacterium]
KKGEIIAYSGESGSGYPHLHLEIRDKHYFALNPFKWIKSPGKDTNTPILKGLLLRNRGGASVNGDIGESYIQFRKKEKGLYRVDRPVLVTGHFDLVLNANDRSDCGRNVAPYSISVMVDNQRYYRLSFDRFERDDNNQLGFAYDMSYSNSSSYYYNLFSQAGFGLEQEKESLETFIDRLDYGKHELRILVEDNYKNVSVGVVPFYKVPPPVFEVSNVMHRKEEDKILLNIDKLESDPDGEIRIEVYDMDGDKVSSGGLGHHRLTETKPLILKGVSDGAAVIDFDFYLRNIRYSRKRFLLTEAHLADITEIPFETFLNRDEVFIKVTDGRLAHRNLRLRVVQGAGSVVVEPGYANGYLYFRFRPLNTDNRVLLHFSVLRGGEKVVEIQERLSLVFLTEGVKQRVRYHEFEASFGVRSVYEPKVLKLEERNYGSEFPVLSRQVSLGPYHFPFLDTVYYSFRKKLSNPGQVGIFQYNQRSGKWRARYTVYDAASGMYKHRVISSGVFALMRDIFPPKVRFLLPRTKFKRKVWRLNVKITDKGKGVNDSSIRVWLNGKRICTAYDCDCEYDPDWSMLRIGELGNLRVGKNLLKVEVKDYAGNATTRTTSFHLK